MLSVLLVLTEKGQAGFKKCLQLAILGGRDERRLQCAVDDASFASEAIVELVMVATASAACLPSPASEVHPEITYSVTYKRGQGKKPEGTLVPGASVKVKEGMVFNVSETGQS